MSTFPQDITLHEAHKLVAPLMKVISRELKTVEHISIENAANRILAEDVISTINVPAQDTAAVDGYAFYYENLMQPLPVTGAIKAGHPMNEEAKPNFAYRIFTGAIMPKGPDTVAMQEHCSFDENGNVLLPSQINQGANYRPLGENVAKDEVVFRKGTIIGSAEIGLAAAIGLSNLPVKAKLKIALISLGDELVEVSERSNLQSGKIFDSNRPMLKAMIGELGHEIEDFGILPDNLEDLSKVFLHASKNADVIICSGGSSEGEEDHVKAAILDCGGAIDFWRLTLKPGRPLVSGRINNIPVFGLPGNPVAAFVCTKLFISPMLKILVGASGDLPKPVMLPSGFAKKHRKGRTEYLRARIENSPAHPQIVLNGRPGAGVLSSLTGADGLVEIPSDHDDVVEGDLLPFFTFKEAGL